MSDVRIVKDVSSDFTEQAFVVERVRENNTSEFFVISRVERAPDTGMPEALAFECDANGNVTCWTDVAGGIARTVEDVILELESDNQRPVEERMTEVIDANGGELPFIMNVMQGMRNRILGEEEA